MSLRAAAAALLALGLLAPACGSAGDGGGAPTSTTTETVTTTAGDALVSYLRSGGVAGRQFQVVVRPDGTFEGGNGKPGRGHLGTSALDELRGLVAAFVAAGPRASYGNPAPDGFTTSIVAGGVTTSVLSDATPPPEVQQLLSFLAGLERQLPR
jgi:ABC-type glycerol-3-phosphate transport system substrate-binding protein